MIRPYEDSDKDSLLRLCEDFWNASCADEFGEFNKDHTSSRIDQILSSGACFVTESMDGFILLVESTNLCNQNAIAAEVAWYVTPSARGGHGISLLKTAIKYCEIKGIHTLSVMYMQSSMPDSIAKIYDRMGMQKKESTYILRLQ